MKLSALILAKSDSKRLEHKNTVDFHGKPMFLWNVEKCRRLFTNTYVSSDSKEILDMAKTVGAIPILRGPELCGDCPNIPVYQHSLAHMVPTDVIVAVQANSPTINPNVIAMVKKFMEMGVPEVMTCHQSYSIYGSVWALSVDKLKTYGDPYRPQPLLLVVDPSFDIHNQSDLELALASFKDK